MAERGSHGTGISWTHVVARDGTSYKGETWNPVTGCTRVSAGCDNCYAFAVHDQKHAQNRDAFREWRAENFTYPQEGPQSLMLAREMGFKPPWPPQYDKPFSTVQLLPERLDKPLRAQKPRAYFVDSMGDLFHEDIPIDYFGDVWKVMHEAHAKHGHVFQVLTKRPERMRKVLGPEGIGWYAVEGPVPHPEPGIWLGTSAEDQPSLDLRLPELLLTPAAVHWVSMEPLLAPLDAAPYLECNCARDPDWDAPETHAPMCPFRNRIDWVVVGGESGDRRRPMELSWARSILDQCRAAGVPVFMKQVSARRPGVSFSGDLDVREWPI